MKKFLHIYYNCGILILQNKTNKDHIMYIQELNHEDIIPQTYSFYNTKRIVQTKSLRVKGDEDTGRIATCTIEEQAKVDLLQFHKVKDQSMINLLLEVMPKGILRDIVLRVLTEGNKKNIVFDTTKYKESYASIYSKQFNTSVRSIQDAIHRLLKIKLLIKLNKYQYMINPYAIVHNNISTQRIAELQKHWDLVTEEGSTIKYEVQWIKSEKLGDSFETKRDLNELLEIVKQGDEDMKELKKVRKEHLDKDIATVNKHSEMYKFLVTNFMSKHNYSLFKATSASLQHMSRYIKKAQKESWSIIDDLPLLHLDSTIKPLRRLTELLADGL